MKGTVGRLLAATVTTFALGGTAAAGAHAAQPLPAPSAVVAKVGDVKITRAAVERWAIARRGSLLSDPDEQWTGAISDAERRSTLAALLDLHTAVLEARRLGVRFADADREFSPKEMESVTVELLPRPATDADRALWVRAQLATYALLRHGIDTLPPLSDAQLTALWKRHRAAEWFTPRQVRAEVVELKTRAQARAALDALRAGESFASVGARLSGSSPVRFHGELQLFSSRPVGADDESPLERALMKASPQALIGPVGADDSWYVARVVEVVAERTRIPLPQVRDRIEDEADSGKFEQVYRANVGDADPLLAASHDVRAAVRRPQMVRPRRWRGRCASRRRSPARAAGGAARSGPPAGRA